ncbi:MAG TPA: T9SS type A sorting domain-containing protein [Ignavibacteriaceae bacterium]|nr:T9SS type A sorting domain-containing protein [Ignavibacteriaceae bacterium]
MISRIILATLFLMGSLSAQTFMGKLSSSPNKENKVISDSVRVLAVMVEFQSDKDEATFGNGKFGSIYSQDYGNTILDPLPHNKPYFESHLEFVKNYFTKVSKGKLKVSYNVLPDVITVSKTMRNYTPPAKVEDFTNLGTFANEVWTKVDSAYQNINFSDYDVFLIFHAGVGRDISLPGSLNIERDLPSVYLGLKTLKGIYGQDFTGFSLPISGGKITNSLIIPETESRELSSLGQTFLFEITINGLLVSSIASHLGLPDLFDTETGLSAIGRFGLMDGQSIFAYSGLFPPEPSAWEKIYLGWAEPTEVVPSDQNISLSADLAAVSGDNVILKVPINSSEYYLVENRQRDVFKDGINIKYVLNGDTLTKNFPKDTTGFYSYTVDTLNGVVMDVDEFDWALPGNGIVIWHIDENVINAKINENKINTDKNRRGVDVEEADGIQDIGEEFTTIFGDVVVGEGEPNDFWFAGNESELFENKFSYDTRPDTRSNDGTNSLITMENFSASDNKMNFSLSFGNNQISLREIRKFNFPLDNVKLNSDKNSFDFYVKSGTDLIKKNPFDYTLYPNFTSFKTATDYFSGLGQSIFGTIGNKLNNIFININNDTTRNTIELSDSITTPPVLITDLNNENFVLVGTKNGIYKIRVNNTIADSLIINKRVKKIAAQGSYYSFITENSFNDNEGRNNDLNGENPLDIVLTKDRNDNYLNVILTEQNNIFTIGAENNKFKLNSSIPVKSFILSDLKGDGENYIVYSTGNSVEAVNLTGASAENFPISIPNKTFKEYFLSAELNGNNVLLTFTTDGSIYFIDSKTGKLLENYSLSVGDDFAASPIFSTLLISLTDGSKGLTLAALNQVGDIYLWNVYQLKYNSIWSEENADNRNSSFYKPASKTNVVTEFFPAARTYNYPNPVYDNETFIRYYVGTDANINIKIYDLAGDLIAELNSSANGGMDNETKWDVSNVASGVYIAKVEASSGGNVEHTTIKIAVIK